MLSTIVSIAAGGALGALARHGVNVGAAKSFGLDFPYGTMIVNVVGSFVMGIMIAVFAHLWQPPQSVKLFLLTGFLGGFTTFSSFSLDVVTLFERQDTLIAALYLIGSVVLSITALFAALALARGMIS